MQHFASFLFAIVLDAMTEDDFVPMIVHALFEFEPAALLWLVNGPAGKDARDFGNIFLTVAAVHAEGMQFHQLTAVVLVESAAAPSLCFLHAGPARVIGETVATVAARGILGSPGGNIRIWTDAQPIVQIEQHGRTFGGCQQQVFEFSEGVRPYYIAFVAGDHVMIRALADEYVEVVKPEIGHHLVQLSFAVDGTQQFALH